MTTGSLEASDEAAKAVAKTPNRVSLADIEANIAYVAYMPGKDFDAIADFEGTPPGNYADGFVKAVACMTLCVVVLKNGFTIVGKSAPADAANFNADLGRKFAREDAIRQIWPLMGYALRERMTDGRVNLTEHDCQCSSCDEMRR